MIDCSPPKKLKPLPQLEEPRIKQYEITKLPTGHPTKTEFFLQKPELQSRLNLAKAKSNEVIPVAVGFSFASDPTDCGLDSQNTPSEKKPAISMDLLELDKHLENSLKVGDVIQMRAGDKNDAIRLVTKDKSYDVQRIPYSNVLLVSDTINKEELQLTANQPENLELLGIEDFNESIDLDLSIDENLDTSLDENIAKKNFPIILRKFCHGAASQYLTVKHARPSVKKMFETIPFYPESISFENLANQIRCHTEEF